MGLRYATLHGQMWCQNVVPMWCHCGFHVVVNVVPRGRHHIGTAGSTWHHDAQRCVVCFFTKSRENAQLACPPSVFCRESRTRCMRALQKGSILAPPRPHADQKKPNRTERRSGDPAKNLFRAKKCRTDVREIAKSGVFLCIGRQQPFRARLSYPVLRYNSPA